MGSLRQNLQTISKMKWKDNAYIADLGLSIQYLKPKDGEVCGILPYVAPEILNGKQYSTASDIYSVGYVMKEILTRTRAFSNYEFNIHLMKKICEEALRPLFTFWTPDCYIELARQCMDLDPQKRAIANDIYNKLGQCIEDSSNTEIENQFLHGDDNFIKLADFNYKLDEWINNLENSGDLDETKQQFLDKDKYSKESSDDHKYKSKYFQKDSYSLLNPLPY
ncbi:kinase-like domain-containing protein [Gigaspora rosea]|uniref:non-specific serine/threonine protein kinase n=1 Tax=Gigaspora rosea TaxID=44941 RepID=A0A397VAT9_9GLOM|nr:kinase-like domain-containing protein [Gigaspora rosea]